jgi:hypothetical protein
MQFPVNELKPWDHPARFAGTPPWQEGKRPTARCGGA